MIENSTKILYLDKALSKSSYPIYTKNFVKDFLIKNYSNNKEAKVYLALVDQQNIFVIEYILPISFGINKIYNIIILMYLPILFPNYPPEFYISKKINFSICDEYQKSINKKNLRIDIDSFVPFDPVKINIKEIINCFRIKFSKDFPIYKTNNNEQQIGKCILDKSKCFLILFQKINVISNETGEYFNDKTFMNYMKTQTKDILREKYMIFREEFNINLDKLQKIGSLINKNNIKSSNDKLEKEMEKLIKIRKYLNGIENGLKNGLKIKNEINIFDKCSYYIKIKNKKVFELIIMKKVLSDYLIFLKKGFEKKVVTFEDMIKKTRTLSRELFNINYTINKLNKIK